MVQVKVGNKIVETRNIRNITPQTTRNGNTIVTFDGSGVKDEWTPAMLREYLLQVKGKGVMTPECATLLLSKLNSTTEESEELSLTENSTMY